MDENESGWEIVEAAIAVHRDLSPGLLEVVYEVSFVPVPVPEIGHTKNADRLFRS